MALTTTREVLLSQYHTSAAGVVKLFWTGATFKTQQDFDDDGVAEIQLAGRLAAFQHYEHARSDGLLWMPFPIPVPEDPDPPDESAPALPVAAKARRVRRAAGVTLKSLAEEIGVHANTISVWERAGARLNQTPRGGRTPELLAKFRRYLEALATMEGYEPTVRRDLSGSTHVEPDRVTGLDGKRRCSQAGCGTILSRFNHGERCACHA